MRAINELRFERDAKVHVGAGKDDGGVHIDM